MQAAWHALERRCSVCADEGVLCLVLCCPLEAPLTHLCTDNTPSLSS